MLFSTEEWYNPSIYLEKETNHCFDFMLQYYNFSSSLTALSSQGIHQTFKNSFCNSLNIDLSQVKMKHVFPTKVNQTSHFLNDMHRVKAEVFFSLQGLLRHPCSLPPFYIDLPMIFLRSFQPTKETMNFLSLIGRGLTKVMCKSENFKSTLMFQINGIFMRDRQFYIDKMVRTTTSTLAGEAGKNYWSDERNRWLDHFWSITMKYFF